MKSLLAIACALALFACQKNNPPTLEFRGEAGPGEVSNLKHLVGGKTLFFSKPRHFEVSLREGSDVLGRPAVVFTVADHQLDEFGDYTEALVHTRLAIIVDGVIVSVPTVNSRMRGEGVIEGGKGGFTAKEVAELIAKIEASYIY